MIVCESIADIRQQLAACRSQKIALVPTMGNLHAGHLALVKRAQQLAQKVVVSIFVNPLQFNEASDFENYPRSFEQDQQQLAELGVDILYAPTESSLYPNGQQTNCKVAVPELGDILEGECRPGHFTGVTTIVNKLFNIVQPDTAIFGEKDFQQLMLIRRMVADLNMPIEIVSAPTCRESNGLAMSSRNNRLSAQQRQQASALYQQLQVISEQLQQGRQDYPRIQHEAMQALQAQGFEPEYVAIRHPDTLDMLQVGDERAVILLAARLAGVRLIDNLHLCLAYKTLQ